jgi:3-keto-disaccharide hydrolase
MPFRPRAAQLAVLAVTAGVIVVASLIAQERSSPGNEPVWKPLFDGRTLTNWQPTKFVGEGAVKVENGQIILEAGKDLTGITWTGEKPPDSNYELTLQAMRVEGRDFFAGVTFPVGDSFCSLIVGGWGGTVVGLSSINGMDASENETSQSIEFTSGRWYTIRIRVSAEKIEAWLDERQIVDVVRKGKEIDIRIEMIKSQPIGVASWRTKAALRDIRLRRLS